MRNFLTMMSSNWVQASKTRGANPAKAVQTAEPEQQGALASLTVLLREELRTQAAHLPAVQAQAGGASSLLPGRSGSMVRAGRGGSETMKAEQLSDPERARKTSLMETERCSTAAP